VTNGVDPASAPLSVETDLSVRLDGTEAALRSTGDRLFLEFPSVVAVVEAMRSLPATERRHVHETLTAADLTLEVRARHRTLAVLGADAVAGPLARELGMEPAELRLGGVLSALWAGVTTTVRRLR
jgi:hypothetical protein